MDDTTAPIAPRWHEKIWARLFPTWMPPVLAFIAIYFAVQGACNILYILKTGIPHLLRGRSGYLRLFLPSLLYAVSYFGIAWALYTAQCWARKASTIALFMVMLLDAMVVVATIFSIFQTQKSNQRLAEITSLATVTSNWDVFAGIAYAIISVLVGFVLYAVIIRLLNLPENVEAVQGRYEANLQREKAEPTEASPEQVQDV